MERRGQMPFRPEHTTSVNHLCLASETVVVQRLLAYGFRDEGIVLLKRHDRNAEEDVRTVSARALQCYMYTLTHEKAIDSRLYVIDRLLYARSNVVTFI